MSAKGLAVVTGASAGIGAEFARQLKARGYELLLVARREDRLQALAAEIGGAEIRVADLADERQLEELARDLAPREPSLLVNNAGFGTKGLFSEIPLDRQMEMHRLHVLATVRLTHAVLPAMVRRNAGGVINVASVAAYARSAGSTSYCATKSWMAAFTEGLYLELQMQAPGVAMQALCPGYTYSEFHDVLGVDRARTPGWMWLQTADVVRDSIDSLDTRKLYVVPGGVYQFFTAVFSKFPVWLRLALSARSPHRKARV